MRAPSLYPLVNKRHFEQGGLLDIVTAKHWMKEIDYAIQNDRYGYQIATQSRGGGGQIAVGGRSMYSLSSYDYLGLIGHEKIEKAACEAIQKFGTGTSGSRLLTGTNDLHLQLEKTIARFIGTEAAMTVTSGYLANMTPLTALLGPKDLIISDERNHKSLMEAFRLTGTELQFFPHNNMDALESILKAQPFERRKMIISEGVFSMDGDICPLPELVRLKQEYGAFLMIDEAHSLGVNGVSGRGIHEYFGMPASSVDIWTGSLSKTIPANGGFIAGDAALILYLQHAGAPFFFSSSLSPMSAAAALAAFEVIESEPERLASLRNNTIILKEGLSQLGYDTGVTQSAVIPVIMGSGAATHELSKALYQHGYLATAVVYPAVPLNKSRLRLCARADMSPAHIADMLSVFESLAKPQQSTADLHVMASFKKQVSNQSALSAQTN